MARSSKQTTEEQFITVKTLSKSGHTAEEIAKIMNIGTPRVYCIRKFEKYEDFIAGRHQVYESWGKVSRKTHKKGETQEKAADTNIDDVIIQLLMQISEQLAIIVGELT